MTIPILLAVLAVVDATFAGFRAAAGRDGRIDKRVYFRGALLRGALLGVLLVGVLSVITGLLVATAGDPVTAWAELVAAATTCVWIFGVFATLTLGALAFWFSPIPEYRLLASIIVLGPLTLIRPYVIVAALAVAAIGSSGPRVWIVALLGGVSMIGLEHVAGRAHTRNWRRLIER
jgi:hypothetical protein